jgi:hypothetical protein
LITELGEMTLAVAIPGAAAAVAAGQAGIELALPDIEARLAALLEFKPTPIDFQAEYVLAQQIVAGIGMSISLGLVPPSIDAQLAIIAGLVADLTAAVVSVNAELKVAVDFLSLLASGSVRAYVYEGAERSLGFELQGFLGNAASCHALVFLVDSDVVWSSVVSSIFKVST